MKSSTVVTIKSTVHPYPTEISFDIWKIIIDFVSDKKIGDGFGSILPYRLINKTFSNIILECIREVRVTVLSSTLSMLNILLSRPVSLQKLTITFKEKIAERFLFYNLICGCKELRILTIYVDRDNTLLSSEELLQIGNNCTKVEELVLKGRILRAPLQLPCFLSSFFNLQKFSTSQDCTTVPPTNMPDWINLKCIGVDCLLNDPLWTEAMSVVPNLREIKIRSDMISDENIIKFSNLCKDKPISKTLEVFESSPDSQEAYIFVQSSERMSDDGLYSVLDTFSNLRAIKFEDTHITLTRTDIVEKLGKLTQLQILHINGSHMFFSADMILTKNWLQTLMPYFPKSLEVIQFLNCEVARDIYHEMIYENNNSRAESYRHLPGLITSEFYKVLPNLREIKVKFSIEEGYSDENSYDRSPDEEESSDGDIGEYRCDGAKRHWCCDGKARYFSDYEDDEENED